MLLSSSSCTANNISPSTRYWLGGTRRKGDGVCVSFIVRLGSYDSEACHPPSDVGAVPVVPVLPVAPVVPVLPVACSGSELSVLCLTFLSGVMSIDLGDRTPAAIDGSASGCIPMTNSTSFRAALSYGHC